MQAHGLAVLEPVGFGEVCGILEKESAIQLESIHLKELGHSFARGGQPILGRDRSILSGARCRCLIFSLLYRGDHD